MAEFVKFFVIEGPPEVEVGLLRVDQDVVLVFEVHYVLPRVYEVNGFVLGVGRIIHSHLPPLVAVVRAQVQEDQLLQVARSSKPLIAGHLA